MIASSAAVLALSLACAPKAQPSNSDKGFATAETWVALEEFGTKIRVPNGWEFARKRSIAASFAKDGRGAWVLAGVWNKADAKEKLQLSLQELRIEHGTPGRPPRDVRLNGITFARQDFEHAQVSGKPAHVVVLAADTLPKGKGILVFIGYVMDDEAGTREELLQSIGSLSPQ